MPFAGSGGAIRHLRPPILKVTDYVAHVTFILGGCRSGKSGYALKTANDAPAAQRIFIATSVPFDEEMQARVQRHRAERGPQWLTVEAPLHLPEAIAEHAGADRVILADCLTLWVSNLLLELHDPVQVETRIRRLVEVLQSGGRFSAARHKRGRLRRGP